MYTASKIDRFNEQVIDKYNIYNSLFMTLPFDNINDTGALLPLFSEFCQKGFQQGQDPLEIMESFATRYLPDLDENARVSLMFKFIQYIERQVVLFDAIEDAAFPIVNNMEGRGSLRYLKEKAESTSQSERLASFLQSYAIRPVLTAHPTQFYPGPVLGIIADLNSAIRANDLTRIKQLLAQLGKTPFIRKEKTTPYDEAVSLIWYLENIFYHTAGEMVHYINKEILQGQFPDHPIVALGFWPGGDRDGNPFVTADITLQVADRLRTTILKCYYREIRTIKRKLTFSGIEELVTGLELKLYNEIYKSDKTASLQLSDCIEAVEHILSLVESRHQSLYADEISLFSERLKLFGFYFATLDIRQNSSIHKKVFVELSRLNTEAGKLFPADYESLDISARLEFLGSVSGTLDPEMFEDELTRDTLASIYAMQKVQQTNGERGCNRYIISNNENAAHVLEVYALLRLCGWYEPTVDIVPLFEIVTDLEAAADTMETLYTHPAYSAHLKRRGNRQTVMLGFSDGTKDGGYLMANWGIYRAKMRITEVSRRYGIDVIFFDGRGGPPARGGGKTHKFYASLGPEIENREIQITIQGQTISSNFGTPDSCRYNLENLFSAGIFNHFEDTEHHELTSEDNRMLDELSAEGYKAYIALKQHPLFVPYLEEMSTLKYFSKANIGSRPAKRGTSRKLQLEDLRAIPFVGSWSQLKQNVPGFYGVGSALAEMEKRGHWEELQTLYNKSLFVKTLLENSMMSLAKSFMPLTAYMKNDPAFGEFWTIINEEFELSTRMLLKLSGHSQLMENYPDGRASVLMREKIVLPLLTIQQYALQRIRQLTNSADDANVAVYEKLVTRSLFGNTNASRNSA